MDGAAEGETMCEQNGDMAKSPQSMVGRQSPSSGGPEVLANGVMVVDTSIEKLYENVYEMQSSDQSPSRQSFESDGEESRIDSELRHLVGGGSREVELMEEEEEEEEVEKHENDIQSDATLKMESSLDSGKKAGKLNKIRSLSTEKESAAKSKSPSQKASVDKRIDVTTVKRMIPGNLSVEKAKSLSSMGLQNGTVVDITPESKPNDPNLGPFLLKQARDLISSGENPRKALELALRAKKSFEARANGKPSLDLVMSLHVTAAIYCSLGRYDDAVPLLEHAIEIIAVGECQEHDALAKFSGYMQLGDTYAMLGRLESSIQCYTDGLEIQKQALGEADPRVGETCRYLAEARAQALQFDEAQKLCQMALDIHRENGEPASLEEVADRRLMGLICEAKGDHEAALEHLVLASMAMVAKGQEAEVASVDCSIGDSYLSLTRYDEAVFAYQKALTVFKTSKGENHPSVASVFVRLAELYNKTGKFREAKTYCENALRIYEKPLPGMPPEEFASGLTNVSVIYESMNEIEEAVKLLKKALSMYDDSPGHQSTIAWIEAQLGVTYYMLGNYSNSYVAFQNAVSKLRASGEKKSAFFGIALNQMGLACIHRHAINEAAGLFEEAKDILEEKYGPYHPDTLCVYSNLAGTYDALGRLEDAIKLLERVVVMREEKLGTANPDVDDEKRRLSELLKESGRVRSRKGRSLENLFDANTRSIKIRSIIEA